MYHSADGRGCPPPLEDRGPRRVSRSDGYGGSLALTAAVCYLICIVLWLPCFVAREVVSIGDDVDTDIDPTAWRVFWASLCLALAIILWAYVSIPLALIAIAAFIAISDRQIRSV